MSELKPTCPRCGYQHDVRTVVVGHIVREHGYPPTEAREILLFKPEVKY